MSDYANHNPNGAGVDCRWVRERLEPYWGFDLPMAAFVRVEDHLAACPACAAAYEALRPRLEAEAIVEFGLENMKPPAEMAREIIAREAAGEPPASRWLSEDEMERMADEIEAEIEEAYAELQTNLINRECRSLRNIPALGHVAARPAWKRLLTLAAALLLMLALPVAAAEASSKTAGGVRVGGLHFPSVLATSKKRQLLSYTEFYMHMSIPKLRNRAPGIWQDTKFS